MSFNYSKLLGRIKEIMGTQETFAETMMLSEKTVSMKLNNKIAWKQTEILKACELLDIPPEDVYLYFFTI